MILIFVVLLHLLRVDGSQVRLPKITENPSDVTVIKGEPATLRCAADGVPEPQISWFKNGLPVSIAPEDPKSHRILLPGGALFFLKATHGRKDTDSGVYWCVARSAVGSARSANATLTVAFLQSEFRTVPQATRAVRGESALLECEVPKGYPEPKIFWRKDGNDLDLTSSSSRLKMDVGGNLLIEVVNHSDAGRYQCVAVNVAGIRESPQAILSVHGRPDIFKQPQSASVLAGEDAYFECQAVGDPIPRITWLKGANVVGSGRTLRLEAVAPADQGVYVCEAESIVGVARANATLSVFVQPTVTITERIVKVVSGETVTLPCKAEGLPTPQISWVKELASNWEAYGMTDDVDEKKIVVDAHGSLIIKDVDVSDNGKYICMAVNGGGADFARTVVRVLRRRPAKTPPTILIGPANQTLPLRSVGILHCDAENARITWSKDGVPLVPGEKITISEEGTLRIEGLQSSNAGLYQCTAKNDAGETHWIAKLAVESPTNPNIVFHRTSNDPLALPGSPSQPRVVTRGPNSITITWRGGARMGASPSVGYMVEYLATEDDPSKVKWKTAVRRLQGDTYTLTDVTADSSYIFVVRAENSHGLSLPSPASDWVDFQDSDLDLELPEVKHIRDALSAPGIRFDAATGLNTTAVQLQWEVTESEIRLDSVLVIWRGIFSSGNSALTTVSVEATAHSIVVGGLEPGTKHEFFLVPISSGLIGRPSKSKLAQTAEESPLPSFDLHIRQINATTVRASIKPPIPGNQLGSHRKLALVITSIPEPTHTLNVTLLPDTSLLLVSGLHSGEHYMARIFVTSRSEGHPISPPATFTMAPAGVNGAVSEGQIDGANIENFSDTWFAVVIGCLLTGSLVIFGAAFWTRKRMIQNKQRSGCSMTSKPSSVNIYKSPDMKPGVMRGWEANEKEAVNFRLLPQAVEVDAVYAEVNHGPTFSSFQRQQHNYYTPTGFGPEPVYRTFSRTKLYSAPLAFSDVSTSVPYASSSGASIYEPEAFATYEHSEETPMFYQSVPIPLVNSTGGTLRNGSLKGTLRTGQSSPKSLPRSNLGYHLAVSEEPQGEYERQGVVQIEFMRSHH